MAGGSIQSQASAKNMGIWLFGVIICLVCFRLKILSTSSRDAIPTCENKFPEFLVCAQVAQTFARDANQAIGHRKHTTRIFPFGVGEPGVKSVEVGAVEKSYYLTWFNLSHIISAGLIRKLRKATGP
jgi:hypothetical protein